MGLDKRVFASEWHVFVHTIPLNESFVCTPYPSPTKRGKIRESLGHFHIEGHMKRKRPAQGAGRAGVAVTKILRRGRGGREHLSDK